MGVSTPGKVRGSEIVAREMLFFLGKMVGNPDGNEKAAGWLGVVFYLARRLISPKNNIVTN